jgi:hypothetical protein
MATEDADALIAWTTTLSPGELLPITELAVLMLTRCDILYVGAAIT